MTTRNSKQQNLAIDVSCDKQRESLAALLEAKLTEQYGPVLSGESLSQALGYPTLSAFRQALSRRTVPVTVFSIPNRRGKFALAHEIANWLASQHESAIRVTKDNTSR